MADGSSSVRDPWRDFDAKTIVDVLGRKGWAGLKTCAAGVELTLGAGIIAVVQSDAAGEKNLARLVGAHGDFPPTPRFTQTLKKGVRRTVYLFRATGAVHSAENLHGAVAGVHILASGTTLIPPSAEVGASPLRWTDGSHPAHNQVAELPPWLVEIMRDPVAAHRAWGVARPRPDEKRELAEWEQGLTRSRGRTVKTFGNVLKIFRGAPCYAGRFRLNRMTQGIEFESRPLPEARVGTFREQIEDAPWGGFSPSEAEVMQAIRTIAHDRGYHPVQEYLSGVRWDGTPRLDTVASEVLHATVDTDDELALTARMLRMWFISAVARALDPGCQVDTALVLIGSQGLRKSSFFRALASDDWFADTEIRIGDKDGLQQIHAAWITEWGELDRITGARHAGEVKAFVARRTDTFRPPYGRVTESFRRSCVLVGSVNPSQFLTDPTGSRRFWCVRVGDRIDLEYIARWRDQLWAEAVTAYRAGERWWLTPEEDQQREEGAERHRLQDPWEAAIERYISGKWRIEKVTNPERQYLTTDLLLDRALEIPVKDRVRAHEMRVGEVMSSLKYVGRQHAVTKAEQGLFLKADGAPKKKLNHWVPKDGVEPEDDAPTATDDFPPEVPF